MGAASGVVGATVVVVGLIALGLIINRGYDEGVATGVICASDTLGQVIPPAVMYLGRVVEEGDAGELFSTPAHPYTRALLESVPRLDVEAGSAVFKSIQGELASPLSPPPDCHFSLRC